MVWLAYCVRSTRCRVPLMLRFVCACYTHKQTQPVVTSHCSTPCSLHLTLLGYSTIDSCTTTTATHCLRHMLPLPCPRRYHLHCDAVTCFNRGTEPEAECVSVGGARGCAAPVCERLSVVV